MDCWGKCSSIAGNYACIRVFFEKSTALTLLALCVRHSKNIMNIEFIKTVKEVVPTLLATDRQVLEALLQSPDHSASAGELRTILGLSAVVQVNGVMGRIGRKLHKHLGSHPDGLNEGNFEWWHVIATGLATNDRGFLWQLRDEVVTGLLACGHSAAVSSISNETGKRVPQFWTAHWQYALWNLKNNVDGAPIQASGSGVFEQRGVVPGDILFIISLSAGHLLLGGRMEIVEIVSRDAAVQILGNDNLYDASQWAINTHGGSPLQLHRRLEPALTKKLLFDRADGRRGLTFADAENLDNQATRGLGKLSPESAQLLNSIIELTDSMPRSGELLTVTEDMLNAQVQTSMYPSNIQSSPKVESDVPMFEGLLKTVTITFTERNPKARAACIAKHGCHCAVCEMNFEDIYGSVGKDYIHVHHIEPLAYANGMREVNPVTDLIPICPNCHAMLHHTDPPMSIAALRTLFNSK